MRERTYQVTYGKATSMFKVARGRDGRITVLVEGRPVDADVCVVPGGISLRLNGKVYDIAVDRRGSRQMLRAGRGWAEATVETPGRSGRRAHLATDGTLKAPMPGRVAAVQVGPGDAVEAGQPLVVIEAMKMENVLQADRDSVVSEVRVRAGDQVEGEAVLLTFEPL